MVRCINLSIFAVHKDFRNKHLKDRTLSSTVSVFTQQQTNPQDSDGKSKASPVTGHGYP
jgi:hypothetical protein